MNIKLLEQQLIDLRKKLTDKQANFADTYIITENATEAYLQVYNANVNSANSNAYILLKKEEIKRYVDLKKTLDRQKAYWADGICSKTELMIELSKIIRDPKTKSASKLKAIQILGRSQGLDIYQGSEDDFTEIGFIGDGDLNGED